MSSSRTQSASLFEDTKSLVAVAARRCIWPLSMWAALATAIVWQGARPQVWRRPVRAEFVRFMHHVGVQGIPTVVIAGVLVGLSLVSEAIFWFAKFGRSDLITDVAMLVMVGDVAPLLVGLIVIGRGGLVMLDELISARQGGQWRALDEQGVDPFVLLVVPRVLSLAISVFCLSAVLVCAALASAYLVALVINHPELKPYGLVLDAVQSVGALGFALLPAKTLLIGFVVGTVCALTALFGQQREIQLGRLMSSAFARSVLSVFAIVGLFGVAH